MISHLWIVRCTNNLKNCKCPSVAFVLLFRSRRQHFLFHPFSHITQLRWSQQGWDVPPSSRLQAMSQPASSCSQGCVYCTLLYRGHCITGDNSCFQKNSSSGSERWHFSIEMLLLFISSILILTNKASRLVPKWSLQAERRGRAFTIWNWSILSVLVGKYIREKKKRKEKKSESAIDNLAWIRNNIL